MSESESKIPQDTANSGNDEGDAESTLERAESSAENPQPVPPAEAVPTPANPDAVADKPSGDGDASPKKPVPQAPAKPAKKAVPKAPSKPAKPARDLPSPEQIAGWVRGDSLPLLSALFDPLPVAKLDILMMQIKKEELLPQHWQVISNRPELDDEAFQGLPEAGRLRLEYGDQKLSRRRLSALRSAWRELAGKQPSLWTVSDLYAAIRRLLDKKVEVDFHDLLSAIRDVWGGMTMPHGREQLEVLWAVLVFQRSKTK